MTQGASPPELAYIADQNERLIVARNLVRVLEGERIK